MGVPDEKELYNKLKDIKLVYFNVFTSIRVRYSMYFY